MSGGSRIIKFCHLFFDGDDRYVFIRSLGRGRSSQAQLVLHIPTCELRVRKVSHDPLDYEATRIDDGEKMLFFLQEQAANRGVQPHISHLYSASDVPAPSTVGDLYRACFNMGHAIPSTTIWRLMTQLADTLHFMRTCGEGVLHADLHGENIFLHYDGAEGEPPNFYLGDFGNAEHVSFADPTRYREDVRCLALHLNRWLFVSPGPQLSERDELWTYLYFDVLPSLLNLGECSQLPDLKPLIELLRKAPAGPPESLPEWMDHRDEDARLPPFYTYDDECLDAVGVDGPWHVAKVSIGIHKKLFTVLDVSPETYSSAVPPDSCGASSGTPSWVNSWQGRDASD